MTRSRPSRPASSGRRTEGIIPAPETNHAIAAVVAEARRAKEEGKERTILFNFSGHGMVDMAAYDAYLAGKLIPYQLPDEEIQRALEGDRGIPEAIIGFQRFHVLILRAFGDKSFLMSSLGSPRPGRSQISIPGACSIECLPPSLYEAPGAGRSSFFVDISNRFQ